MAQFAHINNPRIEEMKQFVLFCIKIWNVHTPQEIGEMIAVQYNATIRKICGKRLMCFLYEMSCQNLISINDCDRNPRNQRIELVNPNYVICNVEIFKKNRKVRVSELNEIVISEKQIEWREHQILLTKSNFAYTNLIPKHKQIVDRYQPFIYDECGKKRWVGKLRKYRKGIYRFYENQCVMNEKENKEMEQRLKQLQKQLKNAQKLDIQIKNENNNSENILQEWNLSQYTHTLIIENGYEDIEDWTQLSLNELKKMGFKPGHCKKFQRKVKEYCDNNNAQFGEEGLEAE
eukprot:319018_1